MQKLNSRIFFKQASNFSPDNIHSISDGWFCGLSVVIEWNLFKSLLRRNCWVCFATDEDDLSAEWVRPCRCRGTTKWVHQTCLQRWVDEKQRGNSTAKVSCPQCGTEYNIKYPELGESQDRSQSFNQGCYLQSGECQMKSCVFSSVRGGKQKCAALSMASKVLPGWGVKRKRYTLGHGKC